MKDRIEDTTGLAPAAQTALASPLLNDFWSQVEDQLERIEEAGKKIKPRAVLDESGLGK